MAADAVIIDDGGSTRIKQLKGTASGKMDDFLDKKKGHPDGDFSNIRVVALKADGTPLLTRDQPLKKSDSFKIISANKQNVECEMENNGKTIHLSLTSDSAGVEPLVEGKQHQQQRRYVVTNAGPIQKVEFTENVPSTPPVTSLFDITKSPDNQSVYTMVILT
jgi:hypothetical protein